MKIRIFSRGFGDLGAKLPKRCFMSTTSPYVHRTKDGLKNSLLIWSVVLGYYIFEVSCASSGLKKKGLQTA